MQTAGRHTARVTAERQETDHVPARAVDSQRRPLTVVCVETKHACPRDSQLNMAAAKCIKKQHCEVSEFVVESVAATSDDDDVRRTEGRCVAERELGVARVFVGRVTQYLRAERLDRGEGDRVHGVHVSDHRSNLQSQWFGKMQSGVGGNHRCISRNLAYRGDVANLATQQHDEVPLIGCVALVHVAPSAGITQIRSAGRWRLPPSQSDDPRTPRACDRNTNGTFSAPSSAPHSCEEMLSSLRGVSETKTSPFAAATPRDTIISVTSAALTKLKELRDTEPDAEKLGLRLSVISQPGEDFRYDLVFEEFLKSAFTDEVRTIDGFKFIIPQNDVDSLRGAELDYNEQSGLVLRNPNRPKAPVIEGLVRDDETSAQVEAIVATEVNPMLAAHGGFVTYAGHDKEGTAYFTMGGGCHGCSMSKQTMLEGVQSMVTEQVKTITRVRDLTDHATGANPYYR